MLYVLNKTKGNLLISMKVQGTLWHVQLKPFGREGDKTLIPSDYHKAAVMPYLHPEKLIIVDEGNEIIATRQMPIYSNLKVDEPTASRNLALVEKSDGKDMIGESLRDVLKDLYIKAPEESTSPKEASIDLPTVKEVLAELTPAPMTEDDGEDHRTDFEKDLWLLTKSELKMKCNELSVDNTGGKKELIARIVASR